MNNDFYSIDKLVEFVMSFSIANQMISTMNQSMDQITMPGRLQEKVNNPENIYFVVIDGKQEGPYSLTELSRLITDKKIVKETYVWISGFGE